MASYSITTTFVKPNAATQWFGDADPTNANADTALIMAQPGYVDSTQNIIDDTTMETTITFNNKKNFNNMVKVRRLSSAFLARVQHREQQGIVTSEKVISIVK